MTETKVAYHVEDGEGRPAINVKDHNGGEAYAIAIQRLVGPVLAERIGSDNERSPSSIAYDRITSDFWQTAEEIAMQRGLGEITQEGRSGGWLVFIDGPYILESGPTQRIEWLAGYRAMVEWAEAWIADAPRKVAALAQQLAMDEAGEPAARRMYGS